MKSLNLRPFVLLFSLAGLLGACGNVGDPTVHPESQSTPGLDILGMLENLRPSDGELAQMLSQQTRNPQRQKSAAGFAPISPAAAPSLEVLELAPYLIDGEGNVIEITSSTSITELADGTLAVMPYDAWYSDDTTTFTGLMELRFEWDANQNIFFEASPSMVLSVPSDESGSYVSGTVYNYFLDTIDGQTHNNGHLNGVMVYATNLDTNDVYTSETDENGAYSLGPITNGAYTLHASIDGFYSYAGHFLIGPHNQILNWDIDLVPAFTAVTETAIVYGEVYDLDGDPLAGAVVNVLDDASDDVVAGPVLTNANGEYMLGTVPKSDTDTYVVEVVNESLASYSNTFSIALGSEEPANVDVEFQNHKPILTCAYGEESGSLVSITTPAGASLNLSVTGTDPDGDFVAFSWASDIGEITSDSFDLIDDSVVFDAPLNSENGTITVYGFDSVQTVTCQFQIDVVEP